MLAQIASGMIVSIDAFFIGIALGMQKKSRPIHLAAINVILLVMCLLGYFLAGRLYEAILLDADLLVGVTFILMGLWTFTQGFYQKPAVTMKSTALIGAVMCIEAMIITMGLTIIFLPYSSLAIPITVGLAHFAYCVAAFKLARMKKEVSLKTGYAVSGLALIMYGVLALIGG
jgi:putative Mn2+ efflux pump MntP